MRSTILTALLPGLVLGLVAASTSGVCAQPPSGERQQQQEVNLPDDAAALADVLHQQLRATQAVRVAVQITGGDLELLEITGVLRNPSGESPAASLKVVQAGGNEPGTNHLVAVGGVMYLKQEGEEFAPGKPWLRISRQELDNPALGDTRQVFEAMLNELEQALRQASLDPGLTALAHGHLTRPPTWETFDGTPVRRYTGTTPTATLADKASDPELRQLAQQMTSGGIRDFPWTVWVDKQGLPRQFVSKVMFPPHPVAMKVTYADWGQPVTIAPPPADQTASIND